MNDQVSKLQELGKLMQDHGLELIIALIVLVVGLFITKWAVKNSKILLAKITKNTATISIISNSLGILLLAIVSITAAMEIGAKPGPGKGKTGFGSSHDSRRKGSHKACPPGICAKAGTKRSGNWRALLGEQCQILGGQMRIIGKNQISI